MSWEDVSIGDLIEYQEMGFKKSKFGIYMGEHVSLTFGILMIVIYKDDVDYIAYESITKVEVRSALKKAKG